MKVLSFFYVTLPLLLASNSLPLLAEELYVTGCSSSSLNIIDTAVDKVLKEKKIELDFSSGGMALTHDGTKAYIAHQNDKRISVVDLSTRSVIAIIQDIENPDCLALTPDGKKLYVSHESLNTVSVIDTRSHTVIKSIQVGKTPKDIVISHDGKKAYVPNYNSGTVSIIDTQTDCVTTVTVKGCPYGIALTPDDKTAYVTNDAYYYGSVNILDTEKAEVKNLSLDQRSIASIGITPDGLFAYIAHPQSHAVSVLDLSTDTPICLINTHYHPYGIAITHDGTKVYVNDRDDHVLEVIDTRADPSTHWPKIELEKMPYNIKMNPLPRFSGVSLSPVCGVSKKDTYLHQTEFFNEITWLPHKKFEPTHYNVFRNDELVATILSTDSRKFEDHNLEKHQEYTYHVTAEDRDGEQSAVLGNVFLKAGH